MFSQSLFAQLMRMVLLLVITLFVVHQNQALIDALAKNATSGGCHQQNLPKQHSPRQHVKHQHMEHH
ncbi:MAG: hypothetical protein JKX76_08745 [Colwellia sp.]|nr:hypothetical protein [Colwellia sp.]